VTATHPKRLLDASATEVVIVLSVRAVDRPVRAFWTVPKVAPTSWHAARLKEQRHRGRAKDLPSAASRISRFDPHQRQRARQSAFSSSVDCHG
jgi:hypothetical protein